MLKLKLKLNEEEKRKTTRYARAIHLVSRDKDFHKLGPPQNAECSGIVLVTIIAGFWRILPSFADRESVFFLFDLRLEASMNQVSSGCLL